MTKALMQCFLLKQKGKSCFYCLIMAFLFDLCLFHLKTVKSVNVRTARSSL